VAASAAAGSSRRSPRQTGAEDQVVYFQVTRGVAPRDHVMPPGLTPTVFMMVNPMKPPTAEHAPPGRGLHHGARLPLGARRHQEHRACSATCWRGRCRPTTGGLETIMFRDGFLTEAAACNVWIVHEGALLGPPKSELVLEGIRVELLRELCEDCGIAYNLRPIPEADVRTPTKCCSARRPRRSCR
jgi:D-alanine transaminase